MIFSFSSADFSAAEPRTQNKLLWSVVREKRSSFALRRTTKRATTRRPSLRLSLEPLLRTSAGIIVLPLYKLYQRSTMISSSSRTTVAKQVLRTNRNVAGRRTSSTLLRGNRRLNRAIGSAVKQSSWRVPSAEYSTEQILKLRGATTAPGTKLLYDAANEKDSCGVGLIANLKSKPSRRVVDVADEMLVRMAHRGGVGCDPCSGDGAGKLFQVDGEYCRCARGR
jgi:hypothetical protein